jgi:predicted 2-oxoglutarate/Fe(II)-dependent dioxygenase YbiX
MIEGADDSADWLPPEGRFADINQWAQVKVDYDLEADSAEQRAIAPVAVKSLVGQSLATSCSKSNSIDNVSKITGFFLVRA